MLTVSILINGKAIYTRTAVNAERKDKSGRTLYKIDDGSEIAHYPDDGCVVLAKKMLDTIHEVK